MGLVAAMVFAGIPIAFSFGLATFGYLATTHIPMMVMIGHMDEGLDHPQPPHVGPHAPSANRLSN
jgi:hypothetical protein